MVDLIIFQWVGMALYISTQTRWHPEADDVKRIQMNYVKLIDVAMGALACMAYLTVVFSGMSNLAPLLKNWQCDG